MAIIKDVYLPTPGDKGGPPKTDVPARDEVGRIMDNSLTAMAKQFEYETMRSNLDRLRTGATSQDQKETMALGKFLLELVESERGARQAAEKAKSAAEQERWKVEADRLHEMVEETKAIAQQGSKAGSDPLATLNGMMAFMMKFDEWKGKQTAGLPREAAATADGPTLITLQQMKQAHEEKMEELRTAREQSNQQFQQTLQVTLEQMRQTHDIAMEDARDRREQMKIQMIALQQREGQKSSQFRDMLDVIGNGVKELVVNGPGEDQDALVEPRVSRQAIGRTRQSKLPVYHCDECGADVPISPEVEKLGRFTCGGCGVQYELEEGDKSNGARQSTQGHSEGPGQPGPGGEAARGD